MRTILFLLVFLLLSSISSSFSYASNSKVTTLCSQYKKVNNPSPSSSLCPAGGCYYYIQTCLSESNNQIVPSINYSGLGCAQASIQLVDITRNSNKAVSVKNVLLSCESTKPMSIIGKAVQAISLHLYRAQIVTGPWHDTVPSNACINVVNPTNDTCLKIEDSPSLKIPLISPSANRFYTPVFKVHGKGNYR